MAVPTPTLQTERLVLRPFAASDGDDLFALQSDAHAMRYWDSPPWTDGTSVAGFLEGCQKMMDAGTGARVVIERRSDSAFVGWCTLNSWSPDFRSASLGFSLSPRFWGNGYATEAADALLHWAFATFDLNRVQAEADTRNAASRRVLEKLGFQLEGMLREDCIVNGVVSDSWVFGLLGRDWQRRSAQRPVVR